MGRHRADNAQKVAVFFGHDIEGAAGQHALVYADAHEMQEPFLGDSRDKEAYLVDMGVQKEFFGPFLAAAFITRDIAELVYVHLVDIGRQQLRAAFWATANSSPETP